MATLNEIAYDIAIEHGKYKLADVKFTDLVEVIKRAVKERYALYVRRDVERNGGSDEFYQTITAALTKVDKSEADCYPIGCIILRTVNKIPKAVRLKIPSIFKFVGTLDRSISFTKTNLEELPFTFVNDYTANIPRYIYKDSYIYVFNVNKIKNIAIEGIFIDVINGSISICPSADGACIDLDADDMEYPIPLDVLSLVKADVLTELINA